MSLAFTPDSRTVAVGDSEGNVGLWDVVARKMTKKLRISDAGIEEVAISPDGAALATTSQKSVVLWRLPGGSQIRTLEGHTDNVYGVAFSPDGRTLASGSYDRTVRVWDLATYRTVEILR